MSGESLDALKDIIPENRLKTELPEMEDYCHDEYPDIFIEPEAVALAENEDEISKILKWSQKYNVPVTPRGSGTGLSGGCLAAEGGLILSLERMKSIREIDRQGLFVTTQPGIITKDLQDAVEKENLFYPPDPASLESCSIGGNVAENAGGPRAYKYGVTRQYVQGLKAILPDGERLSFGGKLIKNVSGYDIAGIICGSEGTLAVITEITLRLVSKPVQVIDLLIPFPSLRDAAETISDFLSSGIVPNTMEFMDKAAIARSSKFIQKELPYMGSEAQLLVQIEEKENIESLLESVQAVSERHNAEDILLAENPVQQELIWQARRNLYEALKQSEGSMEIADVSIPRHRIPLLIEGLRKISEINSTEIINYGHAGDGNVHVHVMQNFIESEEWDKRKLLIMKEIFNLVSSLEGVVSGEHGIGFLKKKYLKYCLDDQSLKLMQAIKKTIDPKNLLNPGKIFI